MRAFDIEMIEQAFALRNIMRPGHALDAPPGRPAFAPVEQDAAIGLGQMVERLDLGVDSLRGPFVQTRIESGRRIHQQRRSGANHFIARRDAVDDGGGHGGSPTSVKARASADEIARVSPARPESNCGERR
jgi:hypothetical protein